MICSCNIVMQRNVQKSVSQVQSCCFDSLKSPLTLHLVPASEPFS